MLRELRHESKEDREWMRELGAFDSFRVPTIKEQDQQQGSDLSHYARGFLDHAAALLSEQSDEGHDCLMGDTTAPNAGQQA